MVCLIGVGEAFLFRVLEEQFPVPAKNIPCFNLQGIRVQDIEINTRINVENRQTGQKGSKFPVIFPVLREFSPKELGA